MPKPLCFMVMPYGRKPTQADAGKGPAEIDFNALWDRAYVPVIQALGYEAVRADQDTGAMIITQMLERLYFADLVLADMTIANGNVYYEVGIRHAARRTGCVLLAADWSRTLFDVAQMRTVRYPLPEGDISIDTATSIQRTITSAIRTLAGGSSPMHESVRGYPLSVDESAASTMKDQMALLAAFQGEVRAVRAAPRSERMDRARRLIESHGQPPMLPSVALALVRLLRDCAATPDDWRVPLAFIDGMPDAVRSLDEVREQRSLALSNTGGFIESIAELEALIATSGSTPERLGLLGGRYKRLMARAATGRDREQALSKAIEHYERGMYLDLNEYYCASNLPALYRARRRKGDEERAQTILRLVIVACERAKSRGAVDPWLRPTLLSAAFDAGDAEKAEELVDEVVADGSAAWQVDSIHGYLKMSLEHVSHEASRARLAAVIAKLLF